MCMKLFSIILTGPLKVCPVTKISPGQKMFASKFYFNSLMILEFNLWCVLGVSTLKMNCEIVSQKAPS